MGKHKTPDHIVMVSLEGVIISMILQKLKLGVMPSLETHLTSPLISRRVHLSAPDDGTNSELRVTQSKHGYLRTFAQLLTKI